MGGLGKDATSAAQHHLRCRTGVGLVTHQAIPLRLLLASPPSSNLVGTCGAWRGGDAPQSVRDVFLSQAASAGVVPTLLLISQKDVEERFPAGPDILTIRAHAHFFVTKNLQSIGFRWSLQLSRRVQHEDLALKPKAIRRQTLPWQPAWRKLGRPLDVEKAFSPQPIFTRVDFSCFSQL